MTEQDEIERKEEKRKKKKSRIKSKEKTYFHRSVLQLSNTSYVRNERF
jgi:hypothetical protein